MDVPETILAELKCSCCETYLKRSPVYLKLDASAVCGHCLNPKDRPDAIRNKQYELLAQLVKFPCKYQEFGCTTTLEYSQETAHESACDFKQFLCPVSESGKCDWVGRRSQFLEHCQERHSKQVLVNPCELNHDIKKNNCSTFLLNAFVNVLFLLQTKVCMVRGKIYHSVRFLGDPELALLYSYTLKIKRKSLEMSKPGKVAPEGCLALQENTSLSVNINSLLDFLDGFDDTKFFITIKKACENHTRGCTYVDTPAKCKKHETLFCEFTTDCLFCIDYNWSTENTLVTHYASNHKSYVFEEDSFFNLKGCNKLFDDDSTKACFILSKEGTLVCEWNEKVNENEICEIKIYSPIHSDNLSKYKCSLTTCGIFKTNQIEHVLIENKDTKDWFIYLFSDVILSFFSDVCFKVEKINS